MNEASQALLITELKTRNPEKVEELQEMMDSGIPEMFVRKMLCEILFQSRIEQIINQDSQ